MYAGHSENYWRPSAFWPLRRRFSRSPPADAAIHTSAVSLVWVEPASGYGFIDTAIERAHSSIDLSMYELSDPTIEQDLVDRAKAGVDVRVILNSAYDGASENASAEATLRAGSVHVVWAPSNQIFHAKYLVIDNATAYIGTGNFVPADYASTRDFWVSDTRSTDVSAIVATFDSDFAGHSVTHQAGGLVWSPGSTGALITLIDSARHSVLVENEEMDSSPIESALMSAAHRGVDVEVTMTEDSEWTSALDRLVVSGVHVRLLSESQIYIHAKVICADCVGDAGTVFLGSENFFDVILDLQPRTRRHHHRGRGGGSRAPNVRRGLQRRRSPARAVERAGHLQRRGHDHVDREFPQSGELRNAQRPRLSSP